MALTDTAIRNAKLLDKPTKMADGGGLYLLLKPNGSRWWRLDYRFGGKRKTLSMGVYPDVGLKEARSRRDEARKLLAADVDPGENRKAIKATNNEQSANSFEVVAREWFAKISPSWAKGHADKIIRRLERDLFPWLGSRPIAEITAPELLQSLHRIEARGVLETAHRALQNSGQVFRYAVQTGRAQRDPSADLRGALAPWKPKHYPALTEPPKLAELLRSMDRYQGNLITCSALKLLPLVFVRPGELRQAKWEEIDLNTAEWRYTVTKTNTPHIVPLATQAVEILKELHGLTGRSMYVFHGLRSHDRPMSENTINAALRYMGYDQQTMTGHGFRAIARTLLDEVLGFEPHIIEHQLAHGVKDPLGRAYNRTKHLPERRKMMQQWADYLDKLKAGAEIIPLHTAA
ncbi:MAG: integrase arm-type DNA-binding domain-containing protein [Thiobacillus sp.]|nr:integrase arm-type DNA-binding domain-containing protein [Thiobacillus sp.]MDP3124347.1 integrase arm-type DNA-binding domain-containing protein [Thiobacillus sp.]